MNHLLRPMKAQDLKKHINWKKDEPLESLRGFFSEHTHVMEPKFDGVRAMLLIGPEENTLYYGHDARLGPVVEHLQGSHNLAGTLLDGEILDMGGDLGSVVGTMNKTKPSQSDLSSLVFVAFDVLAVSGTDATDKPWRERRSVLEHAVKHLPTGVHLCPVFPASPKSGNAILDAGFEGFMIKNREGRYHLGKRADTWLKVKKMRTADCFVVGYEPGRGGYEGMVGSLRMAVYDDDGNEVEVCKHGVFTEHFRRSITEKDGSLKSEVYGQVMEVMYQELTDGVRLRHPHLYRLRPDKTPQECTLEQLTAT